MSSRLAAASNSLFVTTHGGSMLSAIRNKSVSRITAPLPGAASPPVIMARGCCPRTPGIFTALSCSLCIAAYCGRAVQPGTAMTAHGDEVRRSTGAGPSFSASPALPKPHRCADSKSTYALPYPPQTARRHFSQGGPIKRTPSSIARHRDIEFVDIAIIKGVFAQGDFSDHPEIIHDETKTRRRKAPSMTIDVLRRRLHRVKEIVGRRNVVCECQPTCAPLAPTTGAVT